jgi:hypothetical protein
MPQSPHLVDIWGRTTPLRLSDSGLRAGENEKGSPFPHVYTDNDALQTLGRWLFVTSTVVSSVLLQFRDLLQNRAHFHMRTWKEKGLELVAGADGDAG